MAKQFARSYTSDHQIEADGSVHFACSADTAQWPWLTLGARHPITIQAQNFWTSVGAILALGGMEEGQWSALTWTDWRCSDADAGMAVHGTYTRETVGEEENYIIRLFDSKALEIVHMRGRGVVFRNRNFEEWRGKAKREAKASSAPDARNESVLFVPREALGIGPLEHALVGEMCADGVTIPALVSRENGLPPANPMLGGSGDHVNSVHMIEAARQALCLMNGDPAVTVIGGEMELNRYVELGTPFALKVAARSEAEASFTLEQLGRACARLTLRMA